jgi:3-methyladenine DNA glycosylase/8-oxoguanine DNA glycosylase
MSPFPLKITPDEYRATIKSHGWFDLGAFTIGKQNQELTLTYKIQKGEGQFQVFFKNNSVFCKVINGDKTLSCQVAVTCLSLDIILTRFYSLVRGHSDYDWLIKKGYGRYLRSPTLYEDCIKIVSTANTNWGNTKKIVHSLIENYGHDVNGIKSFPEPGRLIGLSESELKENTKCGYRAKSFRDIADHSLKEPNFFLEDGWKGSHAKSFYDRLVKIHGMGPGSASYLCRIYGKPYNYSIDSWVSKRCDELWGLNFKTMDKNGKIRPDFNKYEDYLKKKYEDFKEYGPTVCWFEITRYWHDNDKWEGTWWN